MIRQLTTWRSGVPAAKVLQHFLNLPELESVLLAAATTRAAAMTTPQQSMSRKETLSDSPVKGERNSKNEKGS